MGKTMSTSEILPPPMARLVCDPGPDQEHVEVAVLNGRLEPIERPTLGRFEADVPAGAYKVEFRTGADSHSELVVVTDPGLHLVSLPRTLQVSTAAPVLESTTSHEWQSYPAGDMSRSEALVLPGQPVGDGWLFLFVREHAHEYADPAPRFNPGRGLSLHRLDGTRILDLGRASTERGEHSLSPPPRHGYYDRDGRWTAHHVSLESGAYVLRLDTGSGWVQNQVVHVVRGWQTQVFLIARSYGDGRSRRRRADLARMSLLMARPGAGFFPGDRAAYLTEVALQALGLGRAWPGQERPDMFRASPDNPMLELLGGFLRLRRPEVDPWLLRFAFDNLYVLLGPQPDILALGWALARRGEVEGLPEDVWEPVLEHVRSVGAISAPPMLSASWDLLLEASFTFPALIPSGAIFDEVSTRARISGAWLVWTTEAPERLTRGRRVRRTVQRQGRNPGAGAGFIEARSRGRVDDADEPGGTSGGGGSRTRMSRGGGTEVGPQAGAPGADVGKTGRRGAGGGREAAAPPAAPAAMSASGRGGMKAALPGPLGREDGDLAGHLQATVDELHRFIGADPSLVDRLADVALDAAARRLLQAAVPQADPLLSRMSLRNRAVSARLVEQQVPAGDLIRVLRLPAATLMATAENLLTVVRGLAG